MYLLDCVQWLNLLCSSMIFFVPSSFLTSYFNCCKKCDKQVVRKRALTQFFVCNSICIKRIGKGVHHIRSHHIFTLLQRYKYQYLEFIKTPCTWISQVLYCIKSTILNEYIVVVLLLLKPSGLAVSARNLFDFFYSVQVEILGLSISGNP